jgi:hypothetical protein
MFELGIFCFVLLAAGYWTTLWVFGRRNDVLHGNFVEAEPQGEPGLVPQPPVPRASADSMQALLTAIKRDLKDAAQT